MLLFFSFFSKASAFICGVDGRSICGVCHPLKGYTSAASNAELELLLD